MDKIICIGKNYADHAIELGDPKPEKPVLFLKPPSSAIFCTQPGEIIKVTLPSTRFGDAHFECELVFRVSKQNKIDAFTLGIDLTLRDLQTKLKKAGHPWEISKSFFGSAIIGPWISLDENLDMLEKPFAHHLDGKQVQRAFGSQMIMYPEECLSYASEHFKICAGDVIFTGTPSGVGKLLPGQVSTLEWNQKTLFQIEWASANQELIKS